MYDTSVNESAGHQYNSDADDISDILDDPHCRLLLEYLREMENPASVSSITTYVVSEITNTPPERVPSDVVRRVQTWLHHGQLPALDRHGVVEFDPETGVVNLDQGAVG